MCSSDLTLGDAVCQYTMRIGGVVMALVAVGSLSGEVRVLFVDAVASTAIGIGLMASAIMMMAGSGGANLNLFLYLIFGGMFVSSGIRNGRDYFALRAAPRRDESATEVPISPSTAWQTVEPRPPAISLAERMRRRPTEEPAMPRIEPKPKPVEPKAPPVMSDAGSPKPKVRDDSEARPTPPEGFLASFAQKKPNQDRDR